MENCTHTEVIHLVVKGQSIEFNFTSELGASYFDMVGGVHTPKISAVNMNSYGKS